jgi:hypothetical protein
MVVPREAKMTMNPFREALICRPEARSDITPQIVWEGQMLGAEQHKVRVVAVAKPLPGGPHGTPSRTAWTNKVEMAIESDSMGKLNWISPSSHWLHYVLETLAQQVQAVK